MIVCEFKVELKNNNNTIKYDNNIQMYSIKMMQ